jgi:cobalt-zinc-cadmium efflux system membrane fusion protein
MTKIITRVLAPVTLALILAGCGGPGSSGEAGEKAGAEKTEGVEASEAKEASKDAVTLSAQQIADAGIEVTRPTVGGVAGAIELSATIEGDPQGVQVVSASLGGRLVSLTRNLGQSVGRGDPLAIIESREAASSKPKWKPLARVLPSRS